jgi:endoglucanase
MNTITQLTRREFVIAAGCASLQTAKMLGAGGKAATVALPLRFRGGVSLAGGEFAVERADFSNRNPGAYGQAYQYPQRYTIDYFTALGLGLLRVPFRWERLQPRLFTPLDSVELDRLREVVRFAREAGAAIVLDLHNYGRYRLAQGNRARTLIIDENVDGMVPVPREAFADFWRRLAGEFATESTVVGLGLMNEPHDMKSSDWQGISQAAVNAVREVNRNAHVIVSGDGWASAARFEEMNGPRAWIRDPAERVVYEAHCYFDADGSGKYALSYADELRADPQLALRGVLRLREFAAWCRRNNVPGFLGEFGIPGADAGWRDVLSATLSELAAARISACYWAAGEWWNDYPLSIQPRDNMREPAPQQEIVARFLADRTALRRSY